MLPDVAAASEAGLRALGFRVPERAGDTWLLLLPNARQARRTLRGDRGRITLSEARKRGDQGGGERALLVAPSASPGVLDAARLGRWDLLLWEAPRAFVNGVLYEAIGSGTPGDAPRRRDRWGQAAPVTAPAPLPAGLLDRLPAPGGAVASVGSVGSAGAGGPAEIGGAIGRPEPAAGPRPALEPGAQHLALTAPHSHSGGRPAWTRWAVARLLLLRGGAQVGHVADVLGVSRQAVSRSLTQWGSLVRRDSAGVWAASDPETLLAAWRAAYPGPGGEVTHWWHPLPPLGQSRAAALLAQRAGAWPLVAGTVAAQVSDPSVEARRVDLWLRTPVDLRSAGFEAVDAARATLRTVVPKDPTVWATAQPASVAGQPVVVADRLLAAAPWDIDA